MPGSVLTGACQRFGLACVPQSNKCKEVMGYCGLLVQLGIFEEVEVHFLLVGHTHTDIDASFGL